MSHFLGGLEVLTLHVFCYEMTRHFFPLKVFLDFILNFGDGIIERCISCNRVTRFVHHEFGEVPLDKVAQHATLFGFEVLEEWVSVATIHVNLAELETKVV